MPAYFGLWIGATTRDDFKKEITDLKTLGIEFRQTIMRRIGEEIARKSNLDHDIIDPGKRIELYMKLAAQEMGKSPKYLTQKMADGGFMTFALEDYQLVLTKSIASNRILRVLPQGDEFGRTIRRKKKYGHTSLLAACLLLVLTCT